jgi:putative hydrolase of the HAD superfamily
MSNEIKPGEIKTLFLDIGGVILTNGWDHDGRKRAIDHFSLEDGEEINERHHLTFDTYEEGKLTLDEYLGRTVFYQQRSFSKADFINFMYAQSVAFEENLTFFKELKKQHHLKVIAVSNEGRELNEHRIRQYKLSELFDAYISSCYIHLRKPDKDVWRMACDISQTPPERALYIDDRLMFVQVARSFGIQSLHFQGLDMAKEFMKTCIFSNGITK